MRDVMQNEELEFERQIEKAKLKLVQKFDRETRVVNWVTVGILLLLISSVTWQLYNYLITL
jgi:hypothetical protein